MAIIESDRPILEPGGGENPDNKRIKIVCDDMYSSMSSMPVL